MNNKDLILFDLSCPFCQRCIYWIQERDNKEQFIYSSLDGQAAKSMSEFLHIGDKESLIFIENYFTESQTICYKSKAVLSILWKLGGIYKLWGWKKILPSFLYDWLYDLVAHNRNKLCSKNASYQEKLDKRRFVP